MAEQFAADIPGLAQAAEPFKWAQDEIARVGNQLIDTITGLCTPEPFYGTKDSTGQEYIRNVLPQLVAVMENFLALANLQGAMADGLRQMAMTVLGMDEQSKALMDQATQQTQETQITPTEHQSGPTVHHH
jgi:hypothetical protein